MRRTGHHTWVDPWFHTYIFTHADHINLVLSKFFLGLHAEISRGK